MLAPPDETVLAAAPLAPVHGCPELVAHAAPDFFLLWQRWETQQGGVMDPPFWAAVWPGAARLARYLLDHPEVAYGRSVLDLGCGGAVAGVAAARSGAAEVTANDIDEAALWVAQRNAEANGVSLKTSAVDLIATGALEPFDVILIADMFYERTTSEALLKLLGQRRRATVLIADGGRSFVPQKNVTLLDEACVPVNEPLEGVASRRVKILAFNSSERGA